MAMDRYLPPLNFIVKFRDKRQKCDKYYDVIRLELGYSNYLMVTVSIKNGYEK